MLQLILCGRAGSRREKVDNDISDHSKALQFTCKQRLETYTYIHLKGKVP